jgi:hypothetical protein
MLVNAADPLKAMLGSQRTGRGRGRLGCLSDRLPDHRSGTIVTARPEEQLAPNKPSLSRLALPIAAR